MSQARKSNTTILVLTGLVILFLLGFFKFYSPVLEKASVTKIIGRIEGEEISYSEYLAFVSGLDYELSFEEKKMVLDYLVAKRVIRIYAERSGIIAEEIEPAFLKEKQYARRKILIDQYLNFVVSSLVNVSEDMKREHFKSNPFLRLYSILIPFSEDNALDLIYAAKNALDKGQPFLTVYLEYDRFDTRRRDGFIGIFQQEEIPEPLYSHAVSLSKPFQYSSYFETEVGYMILYRGNDPEFSEVESFIEEVLEEKITEQKILSHMNQLQNRMLINQSLTDTVINSTRAELSGFSEEILVSFLDSAFQLSYNRFKTLLSDLYSIDDISAVSTNYFMQLLREIALQEFLYYSASKSRVPRLATFRTEWNRKLDSLKEEREKKIISYVFNNYASDRVRVSEDELLYFFRNHQESFINPSLIRLQRISLRNLERAREIHARIISSSEDFTSFVMRHSRDPAIGSTQGYTPYLGPSDLGDNYQRIIQNSIGDVIEPLYIDGFYVIYKIIDIQRGAAKSYSDVKEQIQAQLIMDRVNDWIDEIIHKYDLDVQRYYYEL